MKDQIVDTLNRQIADTISLQSSDTLIGSLNEPIKVQLIENGNKIDWSVGFLSVAILSLIAAVFIPFIQKKYEERKSKYGFHLYVKKKIGIIWNLLTHDEFQYKQPTSSEEIDDKLLTFDKLIYKFELDYKKNRETIHPLFAFGIIFNFQNLLFIVTRIQYALSSIDLNDLDEKTLAFGDKLSTQEHHKLNAVFMLIEHYISITTFHDKFDLLKSIRRETKNSKWTGLKVDGKVLKNQEMILNDLNFIRENEASINEILKINKLLIQEVKSFFRFDKLDKNKKN